MRSGLGDMMADTAMTEDVTLGRMHTPPPAESSSEVSHASSTEPIRNRATAVGSDPTKGVRRRENAGRGEGEDTVGTAAKATTTADLVDPAVYQEQLILQEEESRRQHLNHKVARTRIKAALYEFYRSLEMLKNYKVRGSFLDSEVFYLKCPTSFYLFIYFPIRFLTILDSQRS